MTDSQIYTRAAERIFDGAGDAFIAMTDDSYSYACSAIHALTEPRDCARLISLMADVFQPHGVASYDPWFTYWDGSLDDRRDARVWMLLFCAAMAEAGDL